MLPDTGERYLSTPLFAAIDEEMNAEEVAISTSTQGFRFDRSSTPEQAASEPEELDASVEALVDELIATRPIVMFALEWCEFCWSARNLFAAMGLQYESVDLDSVAYQDGDRGNKIRAVLRERTGVPTIPQIYVGGRHIGGCTELFDYQRNGRLADVLVSMGIDFTPFDADPYSLLPKWLHTRAS